MTVILIASFAMLCGFNLGLIAGLILAWVVFRKEPQVEIDYAGGL